MAASPTSRALELLQLSLSLRQLTRQTGNLYPQLRGLPFRPRSHLIALVNFRRSSFATLPLPRYVSASSAFALFLDQLLELGFKKAYSGHRLSIAP